MRLLKAIGLLLALLPLFSKGQTTYLDSLLNHYQTLSNPLERLSMLKLITSEEPETDQRIAYAYQLLDMANQQNADFYRHAAELQLGIGYRFKGDLSSSLEHLLLSLEIAQKINDPTLVGSSYGEISGTYASQGDLRLSVQYMNKAIDIFKIQNDTLNLAIALLNTGYDYYTLQEYDSSILYGTEAEVLVSNFTEILPKRKKSLLAYIKGNMAITQAAIGETDEAIEALKVSIQSLRAIEDYYAVADFLKFMAEIEFDQGDIELAENRAIEALGLAKKFGLSELNRDLNLLLFKIYQAKGNSDSALKYHLNYTVLSDSIENKNVIREMAKQRSSFELAQKETQVQLLEAKQRSQQAVIITVIAVLFAFTILVIVILVYYRSKIRVNRLLNMQKKSLERLNETKDKFFSIISHDLRGPVSSMMGISDLIRFFVESKDEKQMLEMANHMENSVNQLSSLLDNLLNWAMQQQGHFPNVPEKVNFNFMIIEIIGMFSNMAAGKKINLESHIEQPLHLWVDRNSIHTVFRNLINNAIKFTEPGGDIVVSATTQDHEAIIQVTDNGVGMSQSKVERLFHLNDENATYGTAGEKGLGLGLQLVKEFVQMNNGTIEVSSKEKEGTTFTISLPLFEKQKVAKSSLKI